MGELYTRTRKINNYISIHVPTLREILAAENEEQSREEEYYGIVSLIISTPFDRMVQLDKVGIDFTTIDSWELFCLSFSELQQSDTSLVFDNLDLSGFEIGVNPKNGNVILCNQNTGEIIDQAIHEDICKTLCKVLDIERKIKRPANEEAKQYLLERAKKKYERERRKPRKSQLEDLVVAMVCAPEFSYTYESILDLTIYQFNTSLRQIIKRVNYDNTMVGCYAGTISAKEIDLSKLHWIPN